MNNSILDSAKILCSALVVGGLLAQPVNAALCKVSVTGMASYTQYPLFENAVVPPVVMLVMSIDHQLFNKAYTDYTDLDANTPVTGDPQAETTYENTVNYAGYFGTNLCYTHNGANFVASKKMINRVCTTEWSGNFLNWVSMTRLDVLRWVLYGGNRSDGTAIAAAVNAADTAGTTVLERTHIPQDGHAFVKIYRGTAAVPLSAVTPFSNANGTNALSFCNSTPDSSGARSQNSIQPPLIQVARGAWPAWTLQEGYQCDFRGGGTPPDDVNNRLLDLIARVKVCDSDDAKREDFCSQYPNGSYKPTGLLQEYGEGPNAVEFGLMSGSYARPRTGGVMRSEIGKLSDEVDALTGQFVAQGDGTSGIINSIRRIRVTDYVRGRWADCDSPGVPNSDLTDTAGNRKCAMWGNPIGEIYAEAVRYFEGKTAPTGLFAANDSATHIGGIPEDTAWVDPFSTRPRCTNCSIIVVSTGLNSFDRDQIPLDSATVGTTAALRAANVDIVGGNEKFSATVTANNATLLIGGVLPGASDTTTATGAAVRDCSPKLSTGLSNLSGICPEVGSLQGGYDISAMAHQAYITDIRPTLGTNPPPPVVPAVPPLDPAFRQFVTTYTIALGESLPSIDVPIEDLKIRVLPYAQSASNGNNWLSSSIVNFNPGFLAAPRTAADINHCKGEVPTSARCYIFGFVGENTQTKGSFVVNWEDSTWGNDYDQDAVQSLSYCVGSECPPDFCRNTDITSSGLSVLNGACVGATNSTATFDPNMLYLRSEIAAISAGFTLRLGWITSGSDNPGALAPASSSSGSFCDTVRDGVYSGNGLNCSGIWTAAQVRAYTPDDSGATLLENPLFYAAKYGSFDREAYPAGDPKNDNLPNTGPAFVAGTPAVTYSGTKEWDRLTLEGNPGRDGIPDNYFPVRNPSLLKVQLGRILSRISSKVSSGSSAAVVSSTGEGSGAVFQATYSALSFRETDPDTKVAWTGSVRGLWVTPEGKFAEDTNENGAFDPGDATIEFKADPPGSSTVKLFRNGSTNGDPLDSLKPIWDAGKELSKFVATVNPLADPLVDNRSYPALANTGRFITTWFDANSDGKVNNGEQVPFDKAALTPALVNSCSIREANRLIDWVRGVDQPVAPANLTAVPPLLELPALRSRKFDLNPALIGNETMRLGDIVNSSPLVIAKPNAAIDFLYRDGTYTQFASQYRCRRSVVYVGANDGMLHAFNAGFRTLEGFGLTPPNGCPAGTSAAHPKGSELWAYVPRNLLPHLPWMADPNYTHVFYVDGNPQSFDVKAFTPSASNPGGWGTILVVPFRLGGGAISVGNVKSAPAYVIFDVTNPEVEPKLLAEIVPPNNGTPAAPAGTGNARASFAYAAPTVAFDIGTTNQFSYRLLIGTGPTIVSPEVHSTQRATLYTYDLNAIISGSVATASGTITPSRSALLTDVNSLISDLNSADFDFGGTSDAAYFGTMAGLPKAASVPPVAADSLDINSAMTGKLYKLPLEKVGAAGLSGRAQPGREFDESRAPLSFYNPASPIQGKPALTLTSRRLPGILFGTGRMLSRGDFISSQAGGLFILDDTRPFEALAFQPSTLDGDANTFRTQNGPRGLKVDLIKQLVSLPATNPLNASITTKERSFTSPLVFRGIGVFTTFTPQPDQCIGIGQSQLFQINFANENNTLFGTTGIVSTNIGTGAASNPRIFVSPPQVPRFAPNGDLIPPPASGVTVITQDSSGSLNTTGSIENDFDSFGEQSWWEPRESN